MDGFVNADTAGFDKSSPAASANTYMNQARTGLMMDLIAVDGDLSASLFDLQLVPDESGDVETMFHTKGVVWYNPGWVNRTVIRPIEDTAPLTARMREVLGIKEYEV